MKIIHSNSNANVTVFAYPSKKEVRCSILIKIVLIMRTYYGNVLTEC